MAKFDHNFSMTPEDTIEYVREKLPDFFGPETLTCKEIGDGNINYVYRVASEDGKKSLIVKHAETVVRSSGQQTSTDRNRIEAEILGIQRELSPAHVPEIYLYDPVMCCVVMQDIGDHENLRYALIAHKTYPTLGQDLADFMAQTLIRTTDLVLTPDQKKRYTGQFINPAMCAISERLVLTDPYRNPAGRNRIFPGNEEFVRRELYGDEALCLEAGKLKMAFQTKAQSLIHGDLHSGSIFVKPGSTMVLDPEFAFYGPAGYDVGNVVAHFVFAWANAEVTMTDPEEKETFQRWVEQTMEASVDGFTQRAEVILDKGCQDPMFRGEGFTRWYLDDILQDTAGFAGTELIRRVVGSAKVKDLECVQEPSARLRMERICVLAAKAFILNRETGFARGRCYGEVLRGVAAKI